MFVVLILIIYLFVSLSSIYCSSMSKIFFVFSPKCQLECSVVKLSIRNVCFFPVHYFYNQWIKESIVNIWFCLQVKFLPHSLVASLLLVRCQPWVTPTLLTSDPNIHYRELLQDQVLCRLPSQVSLPWLPTLPPSRPLLMLLMLLLLLLLLCVAQCDTNPARWVWLSLVVRSSHCSSRMPNLYMVEACCWVEYWLIT